MAKISQIVVDGLPRDVTKGVLFDSYAEGREVTLFHGGSNLWLKGFIQGVSLESGFSKGGKPTMFNVRLAVTGAVRPDFLGQSVEVFVRTAA